MTETVLATIIAGGFSIVVALLGILARLNKRDHDINSAKLDELLRGNNRVETKIDTHINDHRKGDL